MARLRCLLLARARAVARLYRCARLPCIHRVRIGRVARFCGRLVQLVVFDGLPPGGLLAHHGFGADFRATMLQQILTYGGSRATAELLIVKLKGD